MNNFLRPKNSLVIVFFMTILFFIISCSTENPTNTSTHPSYRYIIGKVQTKNYHSGDQITVSWYAISVPDSSPKPITLQLKAALIIMSNTTLTPAITISTNSWTNQTITKTIKIPDNLQPGIYHMRQSITATGSFQSTEEVQKDIIVTSSAST